MLRYTGPIVTLVDGVITEMKRRKDSEDGDERIVSKRKQQWQQ